MVSHDRNLGFRYGGFTVSTTPDSGCNSGRYIQYDPDHKWITTVDILSNLDMPHYDSIAYQQYVSMYYDGGDPLSFKAYMDSMVRLAQGLDDGTY